MTKQSKAIREELNKDKLYFYLVVHNMTVKKLSKMFGVSSMVIYRIMEENNFNLQLERQNYQNYKINNEGNAKIIRRKCYGNHTLKLG